jgi:hypothetical protein
MIRNLSGSYVLIGEDAPRAVILFDSGDKLYRDRIGVAGIAKANAYTFGERVASAVPCTEQAMQFVALNFQGAHADAVKALCARIALGLPVAGDTGDAPPDGGTRIPRVQGPIPRSPLRGLAIPDLCAVQS